MKVRRIALGCAAAAVCAGIGAAVVHASGTRRAPAPVAVTVAPNGNLVFSPAIAKPALGGAVQWTWGASGHTSTDESGLALWNTGVLGANSTFSFTFAHAGTYNYECTVHFFLGMKGKVQVPVKVASTSATTITLTWASAAPPANFVGDVQEEAPGTTTFTKVTTGSVLKSKSLTLTSGTWKFRARYRNTSTGKMTGWSPARSVTIS